jgi:glycosyltransferase involved in cell wall biosynthesis
MKISIITIAYNAEETIEDTIKSVITQSYDNIEYIIVDGASKDRTMEIVSQYKDQISIIISEPDKGIYDAMNKGVQASTGDLVGILNADDFYANDDVLKQVVNKIQEKKTDSIYADLVYVDRENSDQVTRTWISGTYSDGQFLKGWMPPHPTFFLKKKCYDQFGSYSLKLRSAADYELMLRMLHKHKISVTYLPQIITKMRVGGESNVSLKNRIRANKEDAEAWRMNDLKPGAFTRFRKPLSKVKQFLKK